MSQEPEFAAAEIARRRAAAKRLRGLFADVAPGEDLADEMIADRRRSTLAEAPEDREPQSSRKKD